MKLVVFTIVTVIFFNCKNNQFKTETLSEITHLSQNEETTIFLIRHAEKDLSTSKNPDLTLIGEKRAENWSNHFSNIEFDAVYSSNFTRTKKTAMPTASKNNLELIIYNPESISAAQFLKENKGKTVLVVGHSNTIPFFVNKIIEENMYDEIDESIYNHLYKITINENDISHNLTTVD